MQNPIGYLGTDQSFLAKNVALQTYGRIFDGVWPNSCTVEPRLSDTSFIRIQNKK